MVQGSVDEPREADDDFKWLLGVMRKKPKNEIIYNIVYDRDDNY